MPNPNTFLSLVSALREQMQATLSRSDVLRPIAWLVGILVTATVTLVLAKAPEWLLILSGLLLLASIVLYIVAYLFCLIKDRDALRSERYVLQKLAIEHRLLGDSVSGLFEADEVASERAIADQAVRQIERKS